MSQQSRLAAIFLFLAVLPAIILPELGRANGSSTSAVVGRASVPAKSQPEPPVPLSFLHSSPLPAHAVDRAAEAMFPSAGLTLDDNGGSLTAPSLHAAAHSRQTATLEQPDRTTLTREEYEQFKHLVKISRAAPYEVALVNIAVKGTSLAMYFFVWILGLVIFRYVFNRWFDEDVYTQTWPSVAIIGTMIVCTAWVLVSTVQ